MPDPDIILTDEQFPDALPEGVTLQYALGDSGMDYPHLGLFLAPGSDYVVGVDLDGQLAARMEERGILRVVTAPADQPAEKAADGAKIADPVTPAPTPQRVSPTLLAAAEVILAEAEKAPEQV